jgi:hypothetical protein
VPRAKPAGFPSAPNIPYPVIYGPDFPREIQIHTRDNGRQTFTSRNNQNLFLELWDFNDTGTYTMGQFLDSLPECRERHIEGICPCVAHDVLGEPRDPTDPFQDSVTTLVWEERLNLDACPGIQRLFGYCRSQAQREFYAKYLRSHFAAVPSLAHAIAKAVPEAVRDGFPCYGINRAIMTFGFQFPALIPETWLNFVGYDRTEDDDRHLSENPQCVDFVLFSQGRKAVIEIDGPSHYADYDEQTRRYTVSEARYTKNLRIERSLRRKDWEIYRFSNLESLQTPEEEFMELVVATDLPNGLPLFSRTYRFKSDEVANVVFDNPLPPP